jgi:hypothetical protein
MVCVLLDPSKSVTDTEKLEFTVGAVRQSPKLAIPPEELDELEEEDELPELLELAVPDAAVLVEALLPVLPPPPHAANISKPATSRPHAGPPGKLLTTPENFMPIT